LSARDDIRYILDSVFGPPSEDENSWALVQYYIAMQGAMSAVGLSVAGTGKKLDRSLYFRSAVRQTLADITSFVRRARLAGVFVSDDPSVALDRLSAGRRLFDPLPDTGAYESLAGDIATLANMVRREQAGEISLRIDPRVNITSVSVSFAGLNGLPSGLVNADALRRQQALDRLALLDFSKRKIRILFTSEYEHDGRIDLVVGWRRMVDAAGYRLTVRDVFSGNSVDIDAPGFLNVPNDVSNFYYSTVAPLLSSERPEDVMFTVLRDVRRDRLFDVRVRAWQEVSTSVNGLFRTGATRRALTSAQMDRVRELILATNQGDVDAVTPYPFISEVLYGTREYGWVLAGMNLVATLDRGDSNDSVRAASYLGAKWSVISQLVTAGEFRVPSDPSIFRAELSQCFSTFGLAVTLRDVLERCGVLMFFDDREVFDARPTLMDVNSAELETGAVGYILGAINPADATLLPSAARAAIAPLLPPPAGGFTILAADLNAFRLDPSPDPIDLLSFQGVGRLLNLIVDVTRGT
jgi:hypothetical protein